MPVIQAKDGCALHYDVRGDGPPLVLIPGLGGAASFWSGVAERLGHAFRVIAVDHRGAGRNGRPEGVYRIEQIAADVLAVMDAEAMQAAHIVGHSTGGAVAQTLALDTPGRVRALALSATWPRADARFRALFEARREILLTAGPACYQRLTHALGYSSDYLDAHAAELEHAVASAAATLAPLSVAVARIDMLLAFDRMSDLADIAAPCLVVGATDDCVVPFDQSVALAKIIPGARLEAVSGGHFHPKSAPATIAELLLEFLSAYSA